MTYSCSSPFYTDPDEKAIWVLWDHPTLGKIPFCANPDDPAEHGRQIHQEAVEGLYGPVISYADSHWYSTINDNSWNGHTYQLGQGMISLTGEQPPNSTNQPLPPPPF